MKYAVQMGSGAMIYILSFTKIGPGIQKIWGGGEYTQTPEAKNVNLLNSPWHQYKSQFKSNSVKLPKMVTIQKIYTQ
jgi:hypothetical protein